MWKICGGSIFQRLNRRFIVALWACCLTAGAFADTTVAIVDAKKSWTWTRAQLLARPDAQLITLSGDPVYHQRMTYSVVPLRVLLKEHGVMVDDTIQFVALDGFAASLPARLLLAEGNAAQAWLAIESADKPWPPLSASNVHSAGPFFLVWTDSERSQIKQEQWPYQISRIERTDSLEKRFPMLAPTASIPAGSNVWLGLEVFKTQCSVCHRINGGGDGVIGPDLNQPMNPTQYFQRDALKKLIRNPAQVRTWKDSKMPAFPTETLGDVELDALIAYLEAMAR